MKNLLVLIPVLFLTACGIVEVYEPKPQVVLPPAAFESIESSAVATTSSPVSFTNLTVQEGDWWVKSNAIVVEEATGKVEFTISRLPDMNSDFTSLGLYALHISNDGVYTEITDKRTLYIDSRFRNDNSRYIMANDIDFNTLHKGSDTRSYPVNCIPVAVQGTKGATECFNLSNYLANGKVVLGFLPSNNLVSFGVRFDDAVASKYKR